MHNFWLRFDLTEMDALCIFSGMENQVDIKALRERIGWTQAQLAEWLGVAQGSVSRMETKGRVRGPTMRLLKTLAAEQRPDDVPRPVANAPEVAE
ncbi:helix-turn-helix domain-containing protein [Martelella mediterranea]|uniref:Helix-turn-helix protein n=1 Tax=Martelella mediterranea TaxID=293089 RepID=A0A4R3NVD0_9HYPH|nr:helix-turn-helix transcriptional regulator [Martelella mediterranea]TCT42757.1 helix-turn-helix protein [Martelella mediterranea]